MGKREKRLEKQIQGLKKQAEKHREKIETEEGRKDTTLYYWRAEIERFEERAKEREKKLKELRGKG